MNVKKEYLILGIVIVALAVYLVQRNPDRTHYTLPSVPALTAADITRIQITRPDGTVVLARRDGRWVLDPQGYPVDPKTAQEMVDTIAGLSLTALVSESKNFVLYELDEDHRVNVKAWQGDQLRRDFDAGKAAPSFRHTFVRIAGDDRVFHARDNFSFRFRMGIEDLRDKAVLAFDRRDIREIRITSGADAVALTRVAPEPEASQADQPPAAPAPGPEWQSGDGRPVDGAAVNELLLALSGLRCEKFIEDRGRDALGEPVFSIGLEGAQTHSLDLFAPGGAGDTGRPAVSSASPYPFLLPEEQAKRIMKPPADYVKTQEQSKG
jgi:hypothetical protein